MAAEPAASAAPARTGMRLSHKLALAIAALAAVFTAALLAIVGPRTTSGFLAGSRELVTRGITALRDLTAANGAQSREVLHDLIAHTTDARQRALADLPVAIYPSIADLRAAIERDDRLRSDHLRRNVEVLAQESGRRDAARIAATLNELEEHQNALADGFARDLRTTHLMLALALLAAALLLFGFGLHRLVVHPVATLRAATRRVAAGDLDSAIEPPSGDELGALARDFSAMVREVRQSRAQLAALNRDLEAQVAQKTRELAHAEKMAAIGTLAGGIAHEFNNLIGGIRGCANDARSDEQDPDRRETLDVILRAADRAAAITAQLRRFARPSAPSDTTCDLAAVAREALALVEPEARRRGVALDARCTAPLTVRGDDGALHQVFVNLCTNALQAMTGGGRLSVSGRRDGDAVVVEVADTGVGIAEEDLGRIFEPFFTRRGDDPDPAQRGTGLGLSVTYGIVAAHRGTIEVRSAPGHGTTVVLRLPWRDPDEPRATAPTA